MCTVGPYILCPPRIPTLTVAENKKKRVLQTRAAIEACSTFRPKRWFLDDRAAPSPEIVGLLFFSAFQRLFILFYA